MNEIDDQQKKQILNLQEKNTDLKFDLEET